jgi:DNA-binding transcriptional LysR family regulator
MWELIEFREIRVFLVLAEELHFGRTAARLGLTQSRVSQSLRGFERKLGVKLFERTSRRVVLTAAGERLREAIGQPYDALTAALLATYDAYHPPSSPLRLGANNAASVGPRLLAVIDAYEDAAADRVVRIVELAAADMLAALRRGDVDVIIARLPADDPDLAVGPVMDHEPRVLAVAHDHPLAPRAGVTLEDIADYDVVWTDGVFPTTGEAFIPSRTPDGRPIRLVRRDAPRAPRSALRSDRQSATGPRGAHMVPAGIDARASRVHPRRPGHRSSRSTAMRVSSAAGNRWGASVPSMQAPRRLAPGSAHGVSRCCAPVVHSGRLERRLAAAARRGHPHGLSVRRWPRILRLRRSALPLPVRLRPTSQVARRT